jgi:ketosteroid isomerase-like protein
VTSAVADVPAVIGSYVDTLNAEDWAGFEKLWHPDASLRAVGTRRRQGLADVLAYYHAALAPWVEHRDEATRCLPCGDAVTVELHFRGRTEGGAVVEFDAVDVFDLRHGQIQALSTWYDIAAVRAMVTPA